MFGNAQLSSAQAMVLGAPEVSVLHILPTGHPRAAASEMDYARRLVDQGQRTFQPVPIWRHWSVFGAGCADLNRLRGKSAA